MYICQISYVKGSYDTASTKELYVTVGLKDI